MAHKNDYQIQKQLDKPQTWFCKYYPSRIRNVGEKEITDRQLVFDFKDGRAYEEVAQRTAENMLTLYGKGCAEGSTAYIMTNNHVISGGDSAKVIFSDGTSADTQILEGDVIIIAIRRVSLSYPVSIFYSF